MWGTTAKRDGLKGSVTPIAPKDQRLGLIVLIVICFAAAGIGGAVTDPKIGNWYATLAKPSGNPLPVLPGLGELRERVEPGPLAAECVPGTSSWGHRRLGADRGLQGARRTGHRYLGDQMSVGPVDPSSRFDNPLPRLRFR
jgi:hypothetical protein